MKVGMYAFIVTLVLLGVVYAVTNPSLEGFRNNKSLHNVKMPTKPYGMPNSCPKGTSITPVSNLERSFDATKVMPYSMPGELPVAGYQQIGAMSPLPYQDTTLIKANRHQLISLLEMVKGFLAFEAQELSEKSDPSIQLPLQTARSDFQVLQREVEVQNRNPGIQSTITMTNLNEMSSNLAYLQQQVRLMGSAGSLQGPINQFTEGFTTEDFTTEGFKKRKIMKTRAQMDAEYAQAQANAQARAREAAQAQAVAEAQAEAQAKAATKAQADAKAAQAKAQTEAQAAAKAQADAKAAQAKAKAQADAQAIQAAAKAKAQADAQAAKAKADAQAAVIAKAKADAQTAVIAKAKADAQVAKVKADAQAIQVVQLAKAKADAQAAQAAQAKAKADAQAAQAAQAKAKADAQAAQAKAKAQTVNSTGPVPATMEDLKKLQTNVQAQINKLSASGTNDPVTKQRISGLTGIQSHVKGIIEQLNSKTLSPSDVPIMKSDIDRAFKVVSTPNAPISDALSILGIANVLSGTNPKAMSQLNTLINKYADQIINGVSATFQVKYTSPNELGLAKAVSSIDKTGFPSIADLNNVSNAKFMPVDSGAPVTDRLAALPMDAGRGNRMDAGRGKGPLHFDWRQRAKEIEDQVKKRGLNPADFGITPIKTASPEFSWKGYTKMICTRLQATMDPALPVTCGCPPMDWPGWR